MKNTKCGFVALIGEPNAGKSTLMNRIVGAKVSIVTHKVQTTRARIRGIAMQENSQLVFVDTPGLFKTRRKLDKAMVAAAWSGAADADIVVLIVEAHHRLFACMLLYRCCLLFIYMSNCLKMIFIFKHLNWDKPLISIERNQNNFY